MESTEMFRVLESTGSTNNYAMAEVHAGLAKHGMAWFTAHQTAGRGQRGKAWETEPGQNIALSIVFRPAAFFFQNQFLFSALVANTCFTFFSSHAADEVSIKWPNDIYWRDRKAGGILIENRFLGNAWKWAVVGIGLNINQTVFNEDIPNAVSLKQVTGKSYDPLELARILHSQMLKAVDDVNERDLPSITRFYNEHLYKKNQIARLKKGEEIFDTQIVEVNSRGQLITSDTQQRSFEFGEVEWMVSG